MDSKKFLKICLAVYFVFLAIASVFFAILWFKPESFTQVLSWRDVIVFVALLLIYTLWGGSILYRVQDRTLKLFFFLIILLAETWIFTYIIKRMDFNPTVGELLRCFSYGPMLFIPSLWLCLTLDVFKPKLMRKAVMVTGRISLVFFVLVMTNQWHHWAFYLNSEGKDRHGPLYFILTGYIVLTVLVSFILFVKYTRKRNSVFNYLPIIAVMVLFVAYSTIYLLPSNFIKHIVYLNNFSIVDTFLLLCLMEGTVRTGLISNSGTYKKMFRDSFYRLALVDRDYKPVFVNKHFEMTEAIKANWNAQVNQMRYVKKEITGGYLLKEDDLSALRSLQLELETKQQELARGTELLKKQQELQIAYEKMKTRQKISQEVNREIQKEYRGIEKTVDALPDVLTEKTRTAYLDKLSKLKIDICFLKQRCLLIIEGDNSLDISFSQFSLSMGSLLTDLNNLGFFLGCYYAQEEKVSLECSLKANQMLKGIIEAFQDERGSVLINFDLLKEEVKARVSPSPHFDLSQLPGFLKVEKDDEDYLVSFGGRV
jgi:hypothetical protein